MYITRCCVLLIFALGSAAVLADGRSYMALAGELMGMVEGAGMVRDACAARSPSTEAANARLYENWKRRHKAVLDAAREQLAHANERLKRQGAPGEDPIEGMLAAGRSLLEEHLDGMTPSQLREYCGAYSALIEFKDREASTSLPKLLEIVADADKVLTERERT